MTSSPLMLYAREASILDHSPHVGSTRQLKHDKNSFYQYYIGEEASIVPDQAVPQVRFLPEGRWLTLEVGAAPTGRGR